jgi:hypothetical protein
MTSEAVNPSTQADQPPERAHFSELLLSGHFQLAPAKDGPPQGSTEYEQLVCVGYRPQLRRVDAVVQIKQPTGYLGGVCTAGSQEYVRFFASTDNGATWTDLGLTSFTTWDIPGPKPLDFDVSLPVDLGALCCRDENLVLIRGVLSWEVPPGSPTGPIVYGNGLDVTVQVAPIALGTLGNLFECLHLPIDLPAVGEVASLDQIVEFGPAQPLTARQLQDLYSGTEIPQSRYLLGPVAKVLGDPVAVGAAAGQPKFELTALPGIDLGPILGIIIDPQGDETYEQLGCVGLSPGSNELVATVDVKLSAGYDGGLCTAGSQEYVAFWADWGAGFQYVGTGSVNVHDISSIPAGGLQYSVPVSFPQALTRRRPCQDGALTITIRAVLSWGVPPSDVNPFAVPVWGGHLEAVVVIPPGQPVTKGGPLLESIGGMPVPTISDATGLATGTTSLFYTPGIATACPFGGALLFTGHVINPATGLFGGAGMRYRILVSTNGGATSTPMTEPFSVETWPLTSLLPSAVTQTPDPVTGWVDYLEVSGVVDVVGNALGRWISSGNGQIWISMEAQQGGVPLGSATPWQLVQLDNTDPAVSIKITSGTGSCGEFHPGDLIEGSYSAADNENLTGVSIAVEPAMGGGVAPAQSLASETLTTETGTWSLQTLPTTEPCGYVMVATATDNTIVDSDYIGLWAQAFAGFCLRPPVGE